MLKVNEYFEGKVKSIAVENSEGIATVGVIDAGEFEFGTSTIEIMSIVAGTLQVTLPGENSWKTFITGESFRIEKGDRFRVKASQPVAYLCKYL